MRERNDSADDTRKHPAEEILAPLNKGLASLDRGIPSSEIGKLGWNLLREDLSLPAAVLYEEKLENNLKWMQTFAEAYKVKLAPHGKTTMAPKLFARQLEAGAWGIALATATQARVAYEHGVSRVLMANQLVGKQDLAIVARLLGDPEFDFYCLVDSTEQVERLGASFGGGRRLNVLIEIGVDDGRTGIRDQEQLRSLLTALQRWRERICLSGVELYEGVLNDEASIRIFLRRAIEVAQELAERRLFDRLPFLLSGAGSAWYDVVAEELSGAEIQAPFEVLLRPGCYLTHDAGVYRIAQEKIRARNAVAKQMHSALTPALQIWAYVQSVPERQKAIIAMGKRDVAFDAGWPMPALHFRPGDDAPDPAPPCWEVTKMMDQHTYLRIEEGDRIRVGDMIGFDISHPCLTFDKWRYLFVLDAHYRVVDVVATFF